VTLDVPFTPNSQVVGFFSIVLDAKVVFVESTNSVLWVPSAGEWLIQDALSVANLHGLDRLLARLTLKGNFVWRDGSDERIYLDGETCGLFRPVPSTPSVGDPSVAGNIDLLFPSGDGIVGGDFKMWFWLVPVDTPEPVAPVPLESLTLNPTEVIGDTGSTGTVTLSGPAPVGGALVTLTSSKTETATVPPTVMVLVGETSANFDVTTLPPTSVIDITVDISASFDVEHSAPLLVKSTRPR
jgi:hypothetical protein